MEQDNKVYFECVTKHLGMGKDCILFMAQMSFDANAPGNSERGQCQGWSFWTRLQLFRIAEGTWWFIPLSKWVITLVISGLTPLIPFITRVITHLLSGMNHQVCLKMALLLPSYGNFCIVMSSQWMEWGTWCYLIFPHIHMGVSTNGDPQNGW